MDLDEALELFIVECRELLEDMEAGLLAVETAQEKSEIINAVFRAAHTIKGSSGLFSLDHIVAFTHVVESVLDRVRSGKLALNAKLVALLLGCGDHIRALVDGVASGEQSGSPELAQAGEPLTAALRGYLEVGTVAPNVAVAEAAATVDVTQRPLSGTTGISRCVLAQTYCATVWIRCPSSAIWARWDKSRPLPQWLMRCPMWS